MTQPQKGKKLVNLKFASIVQGMIRQLTGGDWLLVCLKNNHAL